MGVNANRAGARDAVRNIGALPDVWKCLFFAALCTALAFCWQALKVYSEFGGHWTGLFDTGKDFPPPPALSFEHIFVVSDTTGYDGQFYHYVAHDPFFRRGFARHIDNPRLRYGRILVPLVAYALALGRAEWIDAAYIVVVLSFIFVGAYWLARYAVLHGRHPNAGLLFALIPATILSIESLTVDVALMAFCAGFYLMRDERSWNVLPILAAAPLVRETGLLLIGGSVLWAGLKRQWGRVALFALASIPWLLWTWFVRLHTSGQPYPISPVPLSETMRALFQAQNESGPLRWMLDILDRLAIGGSLAAIALGLRAGRKASATGFACAGFAVLGLVLQHADVWENYHAHTRLLSPLYLWLGMSSIATGSIGLLPLYLTMPRFLITLLVQLPLFIVKMIGRPQAR